MLQHLVPLDGIEPPNSAYKTEPLPLRIKGHGCLGWDRTSDNGINSAALYQLSY